MPSKDDKTTNTKNPSFQRHQVPRGNVDEMCFGYWSRSEFETLLDYPGTCTGIHLMKQSLLNNNIISPSNGSSLSDIDNSSEDNMDPTSNNSNNNNNNNNNDYITSASASELVEREKRRFAKTVGIGIVITSTDSTSSIEHKEFKEERRDFDETSIHNRNNHNKNNNNDRNNQHIVTTQLPLWTENVFGVWRQYSNWRAVGIPGIGTGIQTIYSDEDGSQEEEEEEESRNANNKDKKNKNNSNNTSLQHINNHSSLLSGVRLIIEDGALKARAAQINALKVNRNPTKNMYQHQHPPRPLLQEDEEDEDNNNNANDDAHFQHQHHPHQQKQTVNTESQPKIPSLWSALASVKVHLYLKMDHSDIRRAMNELNNNSHNKNNNNSHNSHNNDSLITNTSSSSSSSSDNLQPNNHGQSNLPVTNAIHRLFSGIVRPVFNSESREALITNIQQQSVEFWNFNKQALNWSEKAWKQFHQDLPKISERIVYLKDWELVGSKLKQHFTKVLTGTKSDE